MNELTVLYDGMPSYNITYRNDFNALSEYAESLKLSERKVMVISDSKVASLYMDAILCVMKEYSPYVSSFVFPEGEQSKNLDVVRDAYTRLIEEKFDRRDLIVALGGGVTGDMAGFTAATYLRGIDFIQIPTTLLSMVDSSIGGKTGVDFDSYKNMVGAFYMPRLVYMNLSVLRSLDERQYVSGMGEVIKSALLKDADFYDWLSSHNITFDKISDEDFYTMVYRCNLIKKAVVENDPTEKGERALLNLGHTLGHAIEKYMNFKLLHGECVCIGCILAAYISMKKGFIDEAVFNNIKDIFNRFSLPVLSDYTDNVELDKIISYTKNDKKAVGNSIKFILLKGIGEAFISMDVTDDDMRDALENCL